MQTYFYPTLCNWAFSSMTSCLGPGLQNKNLWNWSKSNLQPFAKHSWAHLKSDKNSVRINTLVGTVFYSCLFLCIIVVIADGYTYFWLLIIAMLIILIFSIKISLPLAFHSTFRNQVNALPYPISFLSESLWLDWCYWLSQSPDILPGWNLPSTCFHT